MLCQIEESGGHEESGILKEQAFWPFELKNVSDRFADGDRERILTFSLASKCPQAFELPHLACLKNYEANFLVPVQAFCVNGYKKGDEIPFPWLREFAERISTTRWSEYRSCTLRKLKPNLDALELHSRVPDSPNPTESLSNEVWCKKFAPQLPANLFLCFVLGFGFGTLIMAFSFVVFVFILMLIKLFRWVAKKTTKNWKTGAKKTKGPNDDEESKVISTIHQQMTKQLAKANETQIVSSAKESHSQAKEKLLKELKSQLQLNRELPLQPVQTSAPEKEQTQLEPVYASLDD